MNQSDRHSLLVDIAHKYRHLTVKDLVKQFESRWKAEWRDYQVMLHMEDPHKCYSYRSGRSSFYHSSVAQCHISARKGKNTKGVCYGFIFYILPLFEVYPILLPELRHLIWRYMY